MKRLLLDYLTFNKSDRNGILFLLVLIFGMMAMMSLLHKFSPIEKADFTNFDKLIAEIEKAQPTSDALKNAHSNESKSTGFSKSDYSNPTRNMPDIELFSFDPNQLDDSKWLKLGLTSKQIKTIKNYESKGGKFYKEEDLKKIYGISTEQYERLKPFIQIAKKKNNFTKNEEKEGNQSHVREARFSNNIIERAELNSADTSILVKLNGIGPVLARRIIKYREKLGGFVSFQQLNEVWGMDSTVVAKILPQLKLDASLVRKIAVNHCTVSELKRHPYLNYNIANNIVLYRDQHGNFTKVQDIKQAVLVNEELFRKIAPYLTLE